MRKSVIVLIISILFLGFSMFWVVTKSNTNKTNDINDMTVEYVDSHFEIDLYDEINPNVIALTDKVNYIGTDEILKEPEITLEVKCSYVYNDANEVYTDTVNGEMVLTKNDAIYEGKLDLEITRDSIESYSCYYKIKEVSGSYSSKTNK
jgi:hypothetical protein